MKHANRIGLFAVLLPTTLVWLTILVGCTPRVELAMPEKPMTINLNVKIEHEVRIKVEKELDQVLTDKSGLF